jgi:phage tail sheath gpL-like
MGTISTAVGLDRISRTSGYVIKKGFFNNETQNLPQYIAIFGEANTANQSGLTVNKVEVTSEAEAAALFGYGSPIHSMVRILRPRGSDGVGGIPTVVYPQISAGGASATVRAWTVTGTATANATHTVVVNGRTNLDFQQYTFDVVIGDTPTLVAAKIAAAINAVLSAPCTAVAALAVATMTSKWKGTTSAQLDITINYGTNAAGLAYSQTTSTDGAGSVDISGALAQFGDEWPTMVINSYGEAQLDVLEAFNGVPDQTNPTGRWSGLVFKPFCAYFGSKLATKAPLIAITDAAARINQVTNVLCPAPNSKGFSYEAAANVVAVGAVVYQNSPNLDVNNLSYPDMPIPSDGNIGDFNDYNNRDYLVKRGCSTVSLIAGAYVIQDLITTYHPVGEVPLQYSYVRNLNLDWNVCDSYRTMETLYLKDKTLVEDNQIVDVEGCVRPKEWKGQVNSLSDELAEKALIKDPSFTKANLQVQISETNPNRFETAFPYKRTGIARIESTTATAGF